MKAALIGYGRFGRLFYKFFKSNFDFQIYDKVQSTNKFKIKSLNFFDNNVDIIFFSIPISSYLDVAEKLKNQINNNSLIVELSSVKTYPFEILKNYFYKNNILGIHPLFGPDSVRKNLKNHQAIVVNEFKQNKLTDYVINSFKTKGIVLKYMSAKEHDKLMAYTLCLTQFIGRSLGKIKLPKNNIGTKGYFELLNIILRTNNDTLQLFLDMNKFNPFSKTMREKVIKSLKEINTLIEKN